MLPKNNRLTKTKDFDNVYKKGRNFFTKILGIKYIKNELDMTRIGLVISQKISKKAVVRNKTKRRLREILRLRLSNIHKGYDIIILTRKGIEDCDYAEIEKNIEYALNKTHLIFSDKG
ncbi:ribonuclease P protein component [Patescibacteria group bacterium]